MAGRRGAPGRAGGRGAACWTRGEACIIRTEATMAPTSRTSQTTTVTFKLCDANMITAPAMSARTHKSAGRARGVILIGLFLSVLTGWYRRADGRESGGIGCTVL